MPESNHMSLRALDPARSVVVEACAGSGKTWLLASRIVRLLLAGVAPGEILAITFTRKAAREIEERVVDWLRLLATADDKHVVAFLAERGVIADAAALRGARGLYENVLAAQPGLTVNTFHGWFLQLVDVAPLSANLAGVSLVESDSRRFDEFWQSFAASLSPTPDGKAAHGLLRLFETAGLEGAARLIRRAYERRSEWLALAGDAAQIADRVMAGLRAQLGAGEPGQALTDFFSGDWSADFQAYLGLLEMSQLKGDRDSAAALRAALTEAGEEKRFDLLCRAMLNKDGSAPAKKPGVTLDRRYTPSGAMRFLDLHARLCRRLVDCIEVCLAERIVLFNAHACAVFSAFLAHVEAIKRARRQIDFVDAEWRVLQLLRDAGTSSLIQARLDARYRHVLLDEFQDTNPLQWQILRAWLDAYSDDSRPRLFLVGDPKQSIYRFRRAEPRLFSVAADFLVDTYDAVRVDLDATRRNAPAIIDVVNAVFLDIPEFMPFRTQTTHAFDMPGRVELMPLHGRQASLEAPPREALRDPLREPAGEAEDLRRAREAAVLTEKIGEIVGRGGAAWRIRDKNADGSRTERPATYADILLLVRTRSALPIYERALSGAGIPYQVGSRGGLLTALEVCDMAALLEFLVMPLDDLKLAHVLRSPLFACCDEDLILLADESMAASASASKDFWWQALGRLAAGGRATAHLLRAARLLGGWLKIAAHLPAHDLLDRLYREGEVFSRYRLAAPESRAAGIEANLKALLLLALDLDGGRYPSLSRFLDELRELRQADLGDAPDEGEIETTQADAGRVRILTIHGAKGLEAPIVWLLDANSAPRPGEPWDVIVDWPPEAPAPRHFSFVGRKEERGALRQPLFEAEARAAQREELNLLYVAMTRARQVFIASGSESVQRREGSAYRLIEAGLTRLGEGLAHGDALPAAPIAMRAATESNVMVGDALPPVGELRPTPGAGERFGLLLHALVERRTSDMATGAAVDTENEWRALGFSEAEYRRVLPAVERLLSAPALRAFFDPARYRRAWNELELADGAGRVLRIDRLVEIDGLLWVLDYKSSASDTARLDEYREQVRGYCRAVGSAFADRTVRGALLFADGGLLEVE